MASNHLDKDTSEDDSSKVAGNKSRVASLVNSSCDEEFDMPLNRAGKAKIDEILSQLRFESSAIVLIAPSNFYELPKRSASFNTWPSKNSPSIDSFVRAGFFYTGVGTKVTCFSCEGSLENWKSDDDPRIKHAESFPHCGYTKQLCGDGPHRQILESARVRQENVKSARQNERTSGGHTATSSQETAHRPSHVPDADTSSSSVNALLDLPISKHLLAKGFQQLALGRCWEDYQRREHHRSHQDVLISCFINQKLMEHIGDNEENILIINQQMRQSREQTDQTCSDTD